MTRIEDQLTEAARQLRDDVARHVDVDAALLGVTPSSRGTVRSQRTVGRLVFAAAALLVVVTAVGVGVAVDREDERTVVADGPPKTAVDPPPTTPAGEAEVAFDVLGVIAGSERAGSIVYAGVARALIDQWSLVEAAEPAPTVDFDRQVVLVLTAAHRDSCPDELVSLRRDESTVTPVFASTSGPAVCEDALVARTHFVAVDRADLPQRFTLVLDRGPDGSYPEQRLDVDLDRSFASIAPPREPDEPTVPDDPDLQAPEPGREITFDGAGDVRLDQVLDPAVVTPFEAGASCGYWGPGEPSHGGDEPLGGLSTGEDRRTSRVLSIMVQRDSRYRTASGVGIGTTLETLTRIYGQDLVVDRMDGWENPTEGLLASYTDVAAVRSGEQALTFYLVGDVVDVVKISHADFWGDDEGCA